MIITNEKGWRCVEYARRGYADGTIRERFVYLNPEDEREAEIEVFELKPVDVSNVRIRITLDDPNQQTLPGLEDKA